MSVTKVVGNQVYGRTERRLTTGRITMADFVGTLEGNHLTYSDAISSTELTITGNQIQWEPNSRHKHRKLQARY